MFFFIIVKLAEVRDCNDSMRRVVVILFFSLYGLSPQVWGFASLLQSVECWYWLNKFRVIVIFRCIGLMPLDEVGGS